MLNEHEGELDCDTQENGRNDALRSDLAGCILLGVINIHGDIDTFLVVPLGNAPDGSPLAFAKQHELHRIPLYELKSTD